MFATISPDAFDTVRDMFEVHKRARNLLFDWMELRIGRMVVDSLSNPSVAMYTYSNIGFITGESTNEFAIPLIQSILPLTITIPPDDAWANLIIATWAERAKVLHRTRMSYETLDIEHVRKLKDILNSEFTLQKIDLPTILNSDKQFWNEILFYFESFEEFVRQSFGYSIKKDDLTVSVAYTAFPFVNNFEIQVSTLDDPQFRRRGLATVVSAAIIEEGLSRGMIPHWDAANPASVKLAQKLGYSNPDSYDVFYWM